MLLFTHKDNNRKIAVNKSWFMNYYNHFNNYD
jgi:hypothetical protein